MINTTKTINAADQIYITATYGRSTIVVDRISGVSSLSEILAYLRRAFEKITGIVVLSLRNCTQGWTQNHTFVLRRT